MPSWAFPYESLWGIRLRSREIPLAILNFVWALENGEAALPLRYRILGLMPLEALPCVSRVCRLSIGFRRPILILISFPIVVSTTETVKHDPLSLPFDACASCIFIE